MNQHYINIQKGFPADVIKWERRKIIACSVPGVWYEDKIGEVFIVRHFFTFGCFDARGRWISFYDLSEPC